MHGRCERMLDERGGGPTFHCHGTHSRLARRGELGPRTQGIGRAQARAASAAARFLRAPSEAARSAWRCSSRCSPRKAPTCGMCSREKRRWRRSPPISAPAICRRASAWGGMRSSPRSPGATPGTSSGRSDRRSRATGPHCRTRSWPRRKPAPCSWCRARTNPTTLNFLPEAHTVLIEAADIVGSYEEAWDRLRAIHGKGDAAPRREPDQRAVADGGYRADHRQRRARPPPAAGADPRLAAARGTHFAPEEPGAASLPFPRRFGYGATHSPAAGEDREKAGIARPVRGGLQCVWPYG